MTTIQFITDDNGRRLFAVLPVELFEELTRDIDTDELYEPAQYEVGATDARYPDAVMTILSKKNCTIQAAWRIYRGMTQQQVADALGIKQATVSEFEKSERPRKDNLERLARLYNCLPEQLIHE